MAPLRSLHTDQRRKTDWSPPSTNVRRRCIKQSGGTGEGACLICWELGELPKGDPGTGVMGLNLSGRGGGVGIPGVGKRVTRIPEQEVIWRGVGKLGGLEHKTRGEAGKGPGFGFCSSITDRTSKSLPFPVLSLSSVWELLL